VGFHLRRILCSSATLLLLVVVVLYWHQSLYLGHASTPAHLLPWPYMYTLYSPVISSRELTFTAAAAAAAAAVYMRLGR